MDTPSPNPASVGPADLKPLTALRFLAALWVVLYTFWPNLNVGFIPNLAAKGYLGVELFFVLSGFILSHVYLEAVGTGRYRYGGFLWARLARVYPLHLATLIGVGALGVAAVAAGMSIDARILSWETLPANLAMVHAWGVTDVAGWNHPSWSISAEWFAYLTFPLFAFVAWRLRDRVVGAAVGAGVLLCAAYLIFERLAGFPLTQATYHWGALRIAPCFAYGCALYLIHRRGGVRHGALAAIAAALGMAISASLLAWDGITVLLGGLVILGLGSTANARAGVMASRPAVYLGEVSYALYMVCAPWQLLAVNLAAKATGAADNRLPPWAWIAVVATLPLVAMIAHHMVERPARTWLKGLAERRAGATKSRTNSPERVLQPSETIV
ncbi:MAG: acyltransferase [Caulobacterales bacterium]|nr:acyltransferase [Caulobacterales bacterium]